MEFSNDFVRLTLRIFLPKNVCSSLGQGLNGLHIQVVGGLIHCDEVRLGPEPERKPEEPQNVREIPGFH